MVTLSILLATKFVVAEVTETLDISVAKTWLKCCANTAVKLPLPQ